MSFALFLFEFPVVSSASPLLVRLTSACLVAVVCCCVAIQRPRANWPLHALYFAVLSSLHLVKEMLMMKYVNETREVQKQQESVNSPAARAH